MWQRCALLVAGLRVVQIETEAGPFFKADRPVGKGAEAQFRSLEVDQDADRASNFTLDATDQFEIPLVIGMAAMAEIETENICAGIEEGADRRFV